MGRICSPCSKPPCPERLDVRAGREHPQKWISWEVFRKIVAGIAPGEIRDNVIELALLHATHFSAKVHLITSLEGGFSTSDNDAEKAKKWLEYAKSRFEAQVISCETHLLIRGKSPELDVVEFAHENDVDEIIVCARKRSPVGKAFLGSVKQTVGLKASCPVVLVKELR